MTRGEEEQIVKNFEVRLPKFDWFTSHRKPVVVTIRLFVSNAIPPPYLKEKNEMAKVDAVMTEVHELVLSMDSREGCGGIWRCRKIVSDRPIFERRIHERIWSYDWY